VIRALVAVAVALPLYELLRHFVVKRIQIYWRDRARQYAEHHGVRVDLFKFGGKLLVREELLDDLQIVQAMMEAVKKGERPTDVRARVEEYIDEIVPAFSLTAYFEFGMKLARAAIRAVYTPLVVTKVPELPENATAVFLINHRSNFDYLVVGWALARQVAISYAVGEWARVFPLEFLFKAFGGFFVRRGFPDPLYHMVLRRYLQLITRRGITQGIFPEGGLTRDGALRSPKVGLLDALLQLAPERELYFVPVGINYDRVLEDNALLAEARGREHPPTPQEKLKGALKLLAIVPWRVFINLLRVATRRLHRHGYVAVAFGEPMRVRDLPQAAQIATATDEERRALAKEVAQILMERISLIVPATPVPLVARAMLELKSGTESQLTAKVKELRAKLDELGVPVALGREFNPHREAQKALSEDPERNRDLARLESDLIAGEEAEQLTAMGLKRLLQRGAIVQDGEKLAEGPHSELLVYYARSLARLPG
jgi:glycerol-3-phosphate O-acyltransferase